MAGQRQGAGAARGERLIDARDAIGCRSPTQAPTRGRKTVWPRSQTLSNSGTLSATNSIAYMTPAKASTGVSVSSAGTASVPTPARPSRPSTNTVAQALTPEAQPLEIRVGTSSTPAPP